MTMGTCVGKGPKGDEDEDDVDEVKSKGERDGESDDEVGEGEERVGMEERTRTEGISIRDDEVKAYIYIYH
jgi:hypothetical protein